MIALPNSGWQPFVRAVGASALHRGRGPPRSAPSEARWAAPAAFCLRLLVGSCDALWRTPYEPQPSTTAERQQWLGPEFPLGPGIERFVGLVPP
jgi:hypothetical protein